jgi:S-adenosylmethionine synthetase
MSYLFTSESVSEGHPDKVADQISDALIDNFLAFDPQSKVACETLVTTGQVVLAGEVKSRAYLDVQEIARGVIRKIGYTKSEYMFEANSCGILSAIHEQSADINQGVDMRPTKPTIICRWHLTLRIKFYLNLQFYAGNANRLNTCARMPKAR